MLAIRDQILFNLIQGYLNDVYEDKDNTVVYTCIVCMEGLESMVIWLCSIGVTSTVDAS